MSIREEIRILETISSRRTERRDSEAVETVTERFDTSGRLLSRTTERRDNRSSTTQDETRRTHSASRSDSLGAAGAQMDREVLETAESKNESEDLQKEEPVEKKGLPWWQKTLMYCGGAALLWAIFRLFGPRLRGVLTAIETLLKIK
ncbi:MAG: hypothetical protein IKH17_08535 [Bacteroidales bacterium]|nr:hypothetical protein [Bacteroidales bacterium]MBR3097910.1 hypothetical protein [Bacteroidales bacterium]MBR6883774.1 hypothetical protein [Bacteroidales bacterium]